MAINYYDLGLPASIMAEIQYDPMEDVATAILQEDLPDLPLVTLIPDENIDGVSDDYDFFVLVRRAYQWGEWAGDTRGFMDSGGIEVHVYTQDPDGDIKGALISEAIRAVFARASREKRRITDRVHIHEIQMIIEPVRKADWATSQGPVQYADLPESGWRYLTTYQFKTRRQ